MDVSIDQSASGWLKNRQDEDDDDDGDDDDDCDDDDDDNQDGGSIDHRWEEGPFGKRPWMVFPLRPTLERLF